MRILKSAMVIGAAGAMVLGLAGPASASTDTVVDPPRDAQASLDIMKIQFQHTNRGVRAEIRVRNLRERGQFVFAVANRSNTFRFGLVATGRSSGDPTRAFYRFRNGDLTRISCGRSRVDWQPRRDIVTMSFPRRCFRALPERLLMAAGSAQGFPSGTTVDHGPATILRP